MSIVASLGHFGAGADEPYGNALDDTDRTIRLHEVTDDAAAPLLPGDRVDTSRFLGEADAADGEALSRMRGPVLDIGCGPGRLVRAAGAHGHLVLGIDVSAIAVGVARRRGLPVLCRSVFGEVPGDGRWGTAMLFDGNIGIGGDPVALLRRCAGLVRAGGGIVVETHSDPGRDRTFRGVIIDDLGRRSSPFPWAEVGTIALQRHAAAADLVVRQEWTAASRSFAEYARA